MKWTVSERARVVELYFRNGCCVKATQKAFRQVNHSAASAQSGNAIRRFVAGFREQGSVSDKKRSGRHPSVANQENVSAVLASVTRSPKTSVRRRSTQLALSKSSLHYIILHDRLQVNAYKIQLVQKLKPDDSEKRLAFSKDFLQQFRGTWATGDHRLIMSDSYVRLMSGS